MQPGIAMALARQHREELTAKAARPRPRPARRPRLPRYHVTWARMLSPDEGTSGAGPRRPRSSWVIIISPGRTG